MKFYKRISPYHYITISLAFLFITCTPALYLPTEEVAENSGVSLENLQQGRQIYVDHCGSCHMLYLPQRFTALEWEKSLNEMQEKVKISDREKKLVLDYLLAGKK